MTSEPEQSRDPAEALPIGRPSLVGRIEERDAIFEAVSRAVSGSQCEAVTVVGSAGVGKSRLVSEVVADLNERMPDVRVYRGAARSDTGVHGAITRILRARFNLQEGTDEHTQANEVCAQVMDLFGDRRVDEILHFLGGFLGFRAGQTVLVDAFKDDPRAFQHVARAVLRRLFEVDAQRAPLVLVFEDIHLANVEGLRMLADLMGSFHGSPITVLCTARPELLARMHDFCAHPAGRHRRIELASLSQGESMVLARMLLAPIENVPFELVKTAVRLGGGNPLLIEQIVRIYFDQRVIDVDADGIATIDLDRLEKITLPMSVEDAVRTRLAALTPAERELLELAALMGETFWVGGLVVLGRTRREPPQLWGGAEDLALQYRDLLKGLGDRGYITRSADSSIADDEEYVFKQQMEREQLASLVAPEDASQYQLVLAEWLEQRLTERGEEQLDLLAHHYERGDRPLRAARCYLASADIARARYANEKAVQYYTRGLELLGEHDVGLRLDAHHHVGDVLTLLGRRDEAANHFRAMLGLAWRLDLKGRGGAAHNRIGRLQRDAGNLDECMRHLGTALALFEAAGDEQGIAACYDDIGKTHWMRGAYDTALRFLQDGLARRERLGDQRAIALSLNNIGLVFQDSGQYKAAYDALVRARDLRREVGDLPGLVVTLNNLGTIHSDRGEDREAITLWAQALESAREIGDRRRQAVLLLNIGEGNYRLRNSDEALRILTEVEALCTDLGDKLLLAEARRGLGKAHFLHGNISVALQYLERALELFEQVKSRVNIGIAKRSLAEVLSVHGAETEEGKRAEKLFRDALKLFESLGAELEWARTARNFADFQRTGSSNAPVDVMAEAMMLHHRAEEIFAKMRSGTSEVGGRATSLKGMPTNPGFNRAMLSSDAHEAIADTATKDDGFDDATPAEGTAAPAR